MAQASKLVDKALLKTLVPPSSLNAENFQELARKATVEEVPAGRIVFKKGDVDRKTLYVLSGEVELVGENGIDAVIRGGSQEARHPVANHQPRQVTARARTAVTLTRFDSDLLDILLTWDQLSGIEVSDISTEESESEDGGDWMTRILQSKAFLRIPPANIQHMFMRLQEMPVKKGQVILRQGDEGDYYYIISRGKFRVTRESSSGSSVTLATLADGDAFGEEALISDAKRNATITADSDGLLMRLSKEDFNELLKAPMLNEVDIERAKLMVRDGAVLMDVRMESEHKAGAIKGSVNIPLFMLRLKAESLDPRKRYICYCETGRRSQAAAYLLSEAGFESYTLKGGLQAVSQGAGATPQG
ncbi:MAG: cyclic nucleotide-binding domain-containing protein [Ectothiorhodospiraceae bacterium]|nr:cyclic nucleotide-binding domain-containing protein [Ectothiorhodospiraceae bacterium]